MMTGLPLVMMLAAATAPLSMPETVVTARRTSPVFAGPVVADAALATMRGGLNLPNGLTVALGIDIQTRVDGVLALHTIYSSDGPNAGIRVFTDGGDAARVAPGTTTVTTAASSSVPVLIIDRSPTGTTILPSASVPGSTIHLVNGDPATWVMSTGETEVPLVENGPPVPASSGAVSLRSSGNGAIVTLDAPMLQIRQLIGEATGAVIANTGNNRAIDTVSSVNVDLQGLSPALMSGIFAVQRLVDDARSR